MEGLILEKEHMGVKINVDLKKQLEQIAKENRRSLTAQVELMLELAVQKTT